MLLSTLGASLLAHLLTSKDVMRAGEVVIKTREGTIRAVQHLQSHLIL